MVVGQFTNVAGLVDRLFVKVEQNLVRVWELRGVAVSGGALTFTGRSVPAEDALAVLGDIFYSQSGVFALALPIVDVVSWLGVLQTLKKLFVVHHSFPILLHPHTLVQRRNCFGALTFRRIFDGWDWPSSLQVIIPVALGSENLSHFL